MEKFPRPCYTRMVQVHAIIRGRVQGVFYRAFTQRCAHKLGLVGWVRNRADGNVELLAQGEKGPLEELLRQCRQGPPAAQVQDIELTWREATEAFPDFMIEPS